MLGQGRIGDPGGQGDAGHFVERRPLLAVALLTITALLAVATGLTERLDRELFAAGGWISGHNVKHVLAAGWAVRMLRLRKPGPRCGTGVLGHVNGAHDDAAVPAVTHDVDAMHRRLRIGRRRCAGIRLRRAARRQHDEGEQQQKGGEEAFCCQR